MSDVDQARKQIETAIDSFNQQNYRAAILSAGCAEEILEGVLHARELQTRLENLARAISNLHEADSGESPEETRDWILAPLRRLKQNPDAGIPDAQEKAKDFIERSLYDYSETNGPETEAMQEFWEKHFAGRPNALVDGADFQGEGFDRSQ
ncbi:MAG: hypothetical protein F4X19_06800 [Acidobacteria bacterium]|nr:hypothetical protein [Acidobacteriota bacterium]